MALGCLFCLQKVLSSMKRPIGKHTGMLPEVCVALFCACVCVSFYVWVHVRIFVYVHTATRRHSLVASASAIGNGIPHTSAIFSLLFLSKQVADSFNKDMWICSGQSSGSTALQNAATAQSSARFSFGIFSYFYLIFSLFVSLPFFCILLSPFLSGFLSHLFSHLLVLYHLI